MSHLGPRAVTELPGPEPTLFFDLYGTLVDIQTDEDDPWVYAMLARYLAYFRVPISPEALQQEYRTRVRTHLERSDERFPEVDVYSVFREIVTQDRGRATTGEGLGDVRTVTLAAAVLFRSLTRRHFGTFPDVHRVLERLRTKYRLGLISNAQWVFTEPELAMADLDRFFPVRVLSSRVGVKKPDPRLFTEAMNALGAAPEASLYVGDNPPRDLAGARNAGMRCVIFRGQDVPYNGLRPDACFHVYADLEAIVDRLFGA